MQKPFDYIAEANVTASNNFHGDLIPLQHLSNVLRDAVSALEELDKIKKAIFYGRHIDLPAIFNETGIHPNCFGIPALIDRANRNKSELIIHSIIGKATEAGELLELLQGVIFGTVTFDEVNFIEEIGDGFWYDAIGLAAVNSTFEETQRINITKLRHRFPNKFTEYDANNRDLFGERKILETGSGQQTPEGQAKLNNSGGEIMDAINRQIERTFDRLNKPVVPIENWAIVGNRLVGDITGHPVHGDAKDAVTSRILSIDTDNNVCETLNTFYKLGKPEASEARPSQLDEANTAVDNG